MTMVGQARALAFFGVAVVGGTGCFTSTNGPATDGGLDAGVMDATTVPEAAGPADASPGPEAAPPDAAVDAPPDAQGDAQGDVAAQDASDSGPPGNAVTVTVLGSFGPEMGDLVVYSDASGNLLTTCTTGANGACSQVVAAGSQATALYSDFHTYSAMTFVGVEPGDSLTVYHPAPQLQPIVVTSFPPSPPAGTAHYNLETGMVGGAPGCTALGPLGTSIPIDMFGVCDPFVQLPVLVTAEDGTYAPVGFTFQKGVTYASGLNDAGEPSVALTGAWSTTFGTASVQLNNVPAGSTGNLSFAEVANGVPVAGIAPLGPDGGSASQSFTTHPGFADFVVSEAYVATSNTASVIATRAAAPGLSDTETLDLSQLLPAIGSATVSTPLTQPGMTWTSPASLAAATATYASLSMDGTGDGGAGATIYWTFVVPASVTSVTAPTLPPAASSWLPNSTFTAYGHSVTTMQGMPGGGLTTYAAFRQVAGAMVPSPPAGMKVPPLPANGSMLMTTLWQ